MMGVVDTAHMQLAFVIKNYLPISHKVDILHYQLGKIRCMFPKGHQAGQLHPGSLILCSIFKESTQLYQFTNVHIKYAPYGFSIENLQFVHGLMQICLKQLPREVVVAELFDFLLYVYRDLENLSYEGKMIAMLRIFLMLDLLPVQNEAYLLAIRDPYDAFDLDSMKLAQFVQMSWQAFYLLK